MDSNEDSQNPAPDQDNNQPAQPDDTGNYNQYLDPDYQKKQKKKKSLLITGVIAGALVIIGTAVTVALLASSGSGSRTAESPSVVQTCDDATCLEVNFHTCTPSEYTYQESDISSVKYKIQGPGETGCLVDMEYLISKYQPEVQGKSMVCDFDNTVDLDSAVQNVLDYPDDYACQGELAEFLKI